jgi:hypothetical protein
MVQRPPFDRNSPPAPGGFDPRYAGEGNYDRGRDPRYGGGPDPRFHEPDPRFHEPDPFDRRQPPPPPPARRGPNRWLLILGGLLLLGAIVFGLSLTRSGPGSDAITSADNEGGKKTAAADPEARCAAPATYDLIKRELFRQAAATRGSGEAVFAKLPSYATLRVSNPVLREQDEGLERVSCTASASLDLPPGLAVVGGRRTLTANIGYDVQPAADSSGEVVTLSDAQGIVIPLSTLARIGGANARPSDATTPVPDVRKVPAPEDPPAGPPPPAPPAEPAPPVAARPDRANHAAAGRHPAECQRSSKLQLRACPHPRRGRGLQKRRTRSARPGNGRLLPERRPRC